jgi:hypothetical protein
LDECEGPVDVAFNRAEALTRQIAWDADAIACSDPSIRAAKPAEIEAEMKGTQGDDFEKVAPIGMWNEEGNLVPLPEKVTSVEKKQPLCAANADEQIRKGVRNLPMPNLRDTKTGNQGGTTEAVQHHI